MASKKIFGILFSSMLKKIFGVEESKNYKLPDLKKILVIKQHNQLGDLLACVSIFRAIKNNYPNCKITLLVSPENKDAVLKNKLLDKVIVFDKKELFFPSKFKNLYNLLKEEYDIVLVPTTVSISFTSNLLAGIANAKIKIGPSKLDGVLSNHSYFFTHRIPINWGTHPDSNVAEHVLNILKPFRIDTKDFSTEISYDNNDLAYAKTFVDAILKQDTSKLIGLHVGAGKPPNRWSCKKFCELIELLDKNYKVKFYLTGTNADLEIIEYIDAHTKIKLPRFINKTIPEVAALISISDLFITNDTGVMHVAGATSTPQISIFGPTNPFNWAPIGQNKLFVRKSEFIDENEVIDVFNLCGKFLEK